MNGVKFNNLHSYLDLNLILTAKTIGKAEIKKTSVEIEGADGEIDLSEYFGDIIYKNRKLTFEFKTVVEMSDFTSLYSELQNILHGKRMQITLDDDPSFYYKGRVNVDDWKSNGRIGTVTIEVDAEPYKYRTDKTSISEVISTTKIAITCNNLRRRVVPTITTSVDATIEYGEYTGINAIAITASQPYTNAKITFTQGDNVVQATGNASGTILIEYQESGL